MSNFVQEKFNICQEIQSEIFSSLTYEDALEILKIVKEKNFKTNKINDNTLNPEEICSIDIQKERDKDMIDF